MVRRRWILPILLFASSCGGAEGLDDASSDSTTEFSEFEDELRTLADADDIQGLSFAVVDSGGVIHSAGIGYADLAESREVTADTLFHIGSTHKALNAFFVATLVEDGYLDWETPVAELIPHTGLGPSITLGHLLTMSAGIPADAEDDLPEDQDQPEDFLAVLAKTVEGADVLGAPGTVFEYSNISASMAGYAAAAAVEPNNKNLHGLYLDLFAERVFAPLGMHDSTLLISEAISSGNYSAAFTPEGGLTVVESFDTDDDLLAPSGSVKSSANDMALFLQALLNDGRTGEGVRVVSSSAIATMWEPALDGYAMGWEAADVDGVDLLMHEGAFDGYLSVILLVPDQDLGLVVLTNSEDAAEGLIAAIPELLLAGLDLG